MPTKAKTQEQSEAKAKLLETLNKGDTVYTVLRHVSTSGMQRHIDVYTIKDNKPLYLSYWTAKLLDRKITSDKDGIVVGGCGMDMGFEVVYNLSSRLFNDGYALTHRWL